MFEKLPDDVFPRCHWYDGVPLITSGSVTDAVSVDPPNSAPENDAVPGSSTLVTVTVVL